MARAFMSNQFHTADHFRLFKSLERRGIALAVSKRSSRAHKTTRPEKPETMRFFSSGSTEKRTEGIHAKLPLPPASLQNSTSSKDVTIVYTGGALCVTLQRSKARFVQDERATRLVWCKDQRLGITFVEMPQGRVAVKDVTGMRNDVSPGQELVRVNKVSVKGESLQNVMELLQRSRSPCELTFTPPPSPIVVSEVLGPARLLGVRKGMVLRSVSGSSMVGANLSDVGSALHGASTNSPVRLTFTSYDKVVHSRVSSSSLEATPNSTRAKLRNTFCIGAVVAAFSV